MVLDLEDDSASDAYQQFPLVTESFTAALRLPTDDGSEGSSRATSRRLNARNLEEELWGMTMKRVVVAK